MKVDSYYVRLTEDNEGEVICKSGHNEILVGKIEDVTNLDGYQLDLRAKEMLRLSDIEVDGNSPQAAFMEDQKLDLKIVRSKMREILRILCDDSLTPEEKRNSLDVYQAACHSAGIIVSSCKTELSIEQTAIAVKGKTKR